MIDSYSFSKYSLKVLLAIWLICQIAAYLYFGVVASVDTPHYIALADQLLNGSFPAGSNMGYTTYVALIAFLKLLDLPIESMAAIQLIVSFLSVLALYRLAQSISNSEMAAFLAVLLYCFWPKFYQWNLIIYTDSLFTSMTIISFYLLQRAKNWQSYTLTALAILITVLIRPPGLGLLFSVIVWCGFKIIALDNSKVYHATIIILSFLAFAFVINSVLVFFLDSFFASYQNAEVIYPSIHWLVAPPDQLIIPAKDHPPLLRLVEIYGYNLTYMAKLFFAKVGLLLAHAKPYYSNSHNVLIAVFLIPTYILSVIGFSGQITSKFSFVLLSFITFQIIMVGLTSENWDGRFLLPILPIVFIFAGIGFEISLKKLKLSKN
jgi:hypothetical protein